MTRLTLLLSALLAFPLWATAQPLPVSWSLAGQWRAHDGNDPAFEGWRGSDAAWRTLRVPANWYSAGWDHQGALWYRTEFSLPARPDDTLATLEFDGVDYLADVWLNGQHLKQHEGYFQRFAVDVTDALRHHNRLAVKVDSPFEDPKTVWPLHKKQMKGILNQHDSRPGGAWSPQGQDANSGGIWAPVRLRLSRAVAIDHLILRPDWSQGLGKPALSAELIYRAPADVQATLTLTAAPDNFTGQRYQQPFPVSLRATGDAPQRVRVTLPMPDAKLWWPVGYGAPHLYQVTATLRDEAGVMDRRRSRTGLRQVIEQPENKGWTVNGTRVFIRGTNYIGSPWLSTMTARRYARDFALVEEMNANAIRVHGHVANRSLYQQADERGLMIWQDVPLQWGYDDSAAFADNAARQSREMVEQFGNSPSVVVWGGQNEPPFNSPWMEKRFPDWHKDLNRVLMQRVADALAEDNTRIVHPYSAVEEHYWAGWYFGTLQTLLEPAKTAIITEFGAQALPNLSTLKTIIPREAWWPASTDPGDPKWTRWKYHNFQPIQTFQNAKVPRGDTMASFIRNTQQYQADLVALAAESYRRQRFQPVTALFQFMFVETWPSINWGVVDYLRQPKAGYYALKRAYQPLLPSIDPVNVEWKANQPGEIHLWIVNDRHTATADARLAWRVTQGGNPLAQGEQPVSIPADSGQQIVTLKVTPQGSAPLRVESRILDARGKNLATNRLRIPVVADE
ncbi:glycoside hydrolase family 2 protein [Siccibacter turicensis]|uniref:glycoside hydrolase family 2 protein n=1 Tax=Siccibacter turicensis TaxID=357233 RepID=UPI002A6B484F|nr:sugar-binding domain-containing protein [Siccibacter turicensis]MDY0971078.1 glycoside hydrolase family 2 TIM barrel-domain containing protein [Siccibacter turicensis]